MDRGSTQEGGSARRGHCGGLAKMVVRPIVPSRTRFEHRSDNQFVASRWTYGRAEMEIELSRYPCSQVRGVLQVLEDVAEGVGSGQQALAARLCEHVAALGLRPAVAGPLVYGNSVAPWLAPYLAPGTRVGLSVSGSRALWTAVRASAVVHIHGMWSPVGALAALAAVRHGVPYVVTPHGMLQPWLLRRRRRLKVAHLRILGLRLLKHASGVHCVTRMEAKCVARVAGATVRTCVIPNSVPPDWPLSSADRVLHAHRDPVVLFVGRLDPVKGLVPLVDAWVRIWPSFPKWRLVLIGYDQVGMWRELSSIAAAAGAGESVTFLGPKKRSELLEWYDRASVFVLPSFSEVIGLANLEAAARGLPVVTSSKVGLEAIVDYQAGFTVRPTSGEIAKALSSLIVMSDDDRRAVGVRALRMVEDLFTWRTVAPAFESLYAQLLRSGRSGRTDT